MYIIKYKYFYVVIYVYKKFRTYYCFVLSIVNMKEDYTDIAKGICKVEESYVE